MQTTTVPKPLTAAAIFRPAKPGRIVQVRPVLKQDREGLGALYARASSRSRYLRFFTAGITIDREVQRLIAPADDHVALLAEHDGLAVGVASYEL